MKLAILSDLHLGYERFFEDAYAQAKEALESASALADAIIIPGDIFDFRAPKPEVMAQGINLFRELKNLSEKAHISSYSGKGKIYTKVPILAIPGTHERRAVNSENAVELLSLAGLLANASEATVVLEKGNEHVAVFGLGGVSEEKVKESLSKLNPTPITGMFNVFFFHQSIYELLPFSDDFIHFNELPEGYDLYVDGHIHSKYESTVHGKPFLIPGSTVLTQLKDGEQEAKGFFIFDTSTGTKNFHQIKSRKFIVRTLDVNASSMQEDISRLVKEAASSTDSKPIVRIVLKGKLDDTIKNDSGLHSIIKKLEPIAHVEISKGKLEIAENDKVEELRTGMLENASIKDFALGVFAERLREHNYAAKANPKDLFEILSSDAKKEEAIKKAIALCFE